MTEVDVRMEALAEAVVFAHEVDAPALPTDDARSFAFERTAAIAAAGLAHPSEPPAALRTRLAAAGLQFCAQRDEGSPPTRTLRLAPRTGVVLAFVCGLAAGVLWLLLLGTGGAAHAPTSERRAALLAEPGAVQLPWKTGPSPLSGSVQGDVVWNDARQEGYLTFRGLPPLDDEHRFQLWIVDGTREGAPVDGGLFAITDAAAETIVPVQARLPIGRPAAFVVTVEPRAGVVVSRQEHVVAIAGW